MRTLHDLRTPALLLDAERLERNLRQMATRAEALGVALRPHVKTHKSVEVARRQRQLGCRGITVSTLFEARVFIDHGWEDLTWAFPLVTDRLDEVVRLGRQATLRLVVDSPEAVQALEDSGEEHPVWLKVDCGYHRAGVDPEGSEALELARRLAGSRRLRFDGLLTHSGQAYQARRWDELRRAAEQEREVMAGLAERLRGEGIEVPAVSVGSTPAMSAGIELPGITEARPGNYAFYDHTQVLLGACEAADCALTVLASVVSSPAGRDRSVIDAGALALSKDPGPAWADPPTWGEVFQDYEAGSLSPDLRLVSLSQEHGVLSGRLPLGRKVRILPNHSCLAAACFDAYHVVEGERVVDRWPIWRQRV